MTAPNPPQSQMSTRSSSPVLPPARREPTSFYDDFEQSFNRLFHSSLTFKEQNVNEILHLSQMITPKTVHGEKKVSSYDFNTDLMNHTSNTKIIIPLVQLPLFKVETKGKNPFINPMSLIETFLGRKTKAVPKGNKKKGSSEKDIEENNDKDIIGEIERDMAKEKENENETEHLAPLIQNNQSNVYNVNITNLNINYNNSAPSKDIIQDIKGLLLEKGLKYDITHQKDCKDFKFSLGDYACLIRQDQEKKNFLCFVKTFNDSNRDKDVIVTKESDILKELKILKEELRQCVRK